MSRKDWPPRLVPFLGPVRLSTMTPVGSSERGHSPVQRGQVYWFSRKRLMGPRKTDGCQCSSPPLFLFFSCFWYSFSTSQVNNRPPRTVVSYPNYGNTFSEVSRQAGKLRKKIHTCIVRKGDGPFLHCCPWYNLRLSFGNGLRFRRLWLEILTFLIKTINI